MHASPHVCLVSRSLLGCGGVNNVLLSVSMKYCASCLLWGGGGGGQKRRIVRVHEVKCACCLLWGGGRGNNLLLSPARWHMLRHTISPLVQHLTYSNDCSQIPWFVACWFPFIPVVVSLSKDKNVSVFVC